MRGTFAGVNFLQLLTFLLVFVLILGFVSSGKGGHTTSYPVEFSVYQRWTKAHQ
ncbi:hypothetical protein AA0117_g6084 [Alternaria alternata]|uniref:Uncharacterized protein n=1 Tax=Alternaria alternata TaxID=5599 RepID=A0A4Q4NFJ8_ALTAL|nr:hypothetical protein AA0117_g6084 [Alternaria alternata]